MRMMLNDPSRRVWLTTLAIAVAIAGIGAGVALLGGDADDGVEVLPQRVTPRPSPTPTATPSPDATESPEPTTEPTPTPTPAPQTEPPTQTEAPNATPAGTAPPTVSAASIDCSDDQRFCSNSTGRMRVSDGTLESSGQTPHEIDYSQVPTTTMDWQIQTTGREAAERGDPVEMLVVKVLVENRTANRTFVFPDREIALDVEHSGNAGDTLVTEGESFEMPPGGKLEATYEIPITSDGDYRWRAKTWFYER